MIHSVDSFLFWITFCLTLISLFTYIACLPFQRKELANAAFITLAAAFAFHTAFLVVRMLTVRHAPLTDLFEYLCTFVWFSLLTSLVVIRVTRLPVLGAFFLPVIFMVLTSASLITTEGTTQIAPALKSWWLVIHVSMAAASEAIFALAFAASVLYLLKASWEKHGSPPWLGTRVPSLDTLDTITYKAVSAGYPLFTVGALFAGAIWAYKAWGRFWGWDPKETCSLIVWLVYSIYLHARFVRGWNPARLSWLAIIGFILAVLTIFSGTIMGGLHSYL